jgi:hypothetical protein
MNFSWNIPPPVGVSLLNNARRVRVRRRGVSMFHSSQRPLLASLAAFALALLPVTVGAADKTEISERGIPHFEAQLPSGARIALHLRSGNVRIVGSDDGKLTVDISGKNKGNIDDLRYRFTRSSGRAELNVSGGPRNDLDIEVRIPRNSELYARVPAGDVTIENITGSKDVELRAGDLTISVGNPSDYSHVEASVMAGDLQASPFGESHSGLFRSFKKSGSGKYTLYAHIGAGDLTLK